MNKPIRNNQTGTVPFSVPFYYGWVIVGIAALGLFFSGPGQTYGVSTFIDAYIEKFNWSRTTISSMYSLATLAAGLLLFLVGRSIDRFGQRYVVTAVSFLLGLACLWNAFVVTPVMLLFGFL